jgi:hypothetical protein
MLEVHPEESSSLRAETCKLEGMIENAYQQIV